MEFDTDEPRMPCPFGMLAATMALMTRYADPASGQTGQGVHEVHPLLARKIVSNLFFLQHHPALPEHFAQVVAQVRAQWKALADAKAGRQAGFASVAALSTTAH